MPLLFCEVDGATPASWQEAAGYRVRDLADPGNSPDGFTLLRGLSTGIHFTNELASTRSLTNQVLLNGAGVAAGDVDGDGWCDLYFCNLDGANALYHNLGGWNFEEIAEKSGVECRGLSSSGAILTDMDGDGDLDLILSTLGNGTHLYLNDGRGHFTERKNWHGQRSRKAGTSMAVGDVNGDGYPELYVANYRASALSDLPGTRFTFKTVDGRQTVATVDGQPATDPSLARRFQVNSRGGIEENGEEDDFYFNLGGTNLAHISFLGGGFLDASGQPLTESPLDWGLAVAFRDLNGDGLPDLYVCNDFDSPDRIWLNDGGRRFKAAPLEFVRKQSLFSMGVDFADINRDGAVDFITVDMLSTQHARRMNVAPDRTPPGSNLADPSSRPQYSMNTLFLNRGDQTFAEIASLAGVSATEWSWCPVFLDVDLDGWEDLLVSNGNERDSRSMDTQTALKELRQGRNFSRQEMLAQRTLFPGYASHSLVFRNQRDLSFRPMNQSWRFGVEETVAHGVALADLDNDGDQDVVMNLLNHEAAIYRNDAASPRIAVRLHSSTPNHHGIGARVVVRGGPVEQSQEIQSGGRYLSSDEPQRTFAAGPTSANPRPLQIEIRWRSGRVSRVDSASAGHLYEVEEPMQATVIPIKEPASQPLFGNESSKLPYVHREEPTEDLVRQPLLPWKLSQAGPGIAWFDLNGDGREDLVIAGGRGGLPGAYLTHTNGSFQPWVAGVWSATLDRDLLAVVGVVGRDGQRSLLFSSTEDDSGSGPDSSVLHFGIDALRREPAVGTLAGEAIALAYGDVTGDGIPDLFVGGTSTAARYPQASPSRLYRGTGKGWEEDSKSLPAMAGLGMVSSAVMTDLDNDGWLDLVTVSSWGLVNVLMNRRGQLENATRSLGLDAYRGWWNSVTVGDFDGDGRLDIIAGNAGRNHRYQAHRERPLRLYHLDWQSEGPRALLEAWFDPAAGKYLPVRQRDSLAKGLPSVAAAYRSNQLFAQAGAEDLLKNLPGGSPAVVEANWLESTLFLNRTSRFEPVILPVEVQYSSVAGITAADFDGDGNTDLFVAQNLVRYQPETPREDAGLGVLMLGNGHGGLHSLSVRESGIGTCGPQRGTAACDYDGDGRLDLAVAQNQGSVLLLHNLRARPSRRIHFVGPAENRLGIGVQFRGGNGSQWGPRQEIHAGSGYLSQDSTVGLMARREDWTHLQIRWPGGAEQVIQLPSANEFTVDIHGTIRAVSELPGK